MDEAPRRVADTSIPSWSCCVPTADTARRCGLISVYQHVYHQPQRSRLAASRCFSVSQSSLCLVITLCKCCNSRDKYCGTSLRDDALNFYDELPVQLQVDLYETVAALERRFRDNKLPETYMASLQTLKKQPKFQRSVAKAYPGIVGTTLHEDMTIENLVSGLSDTNLVFDVLTKKPKSVQKAVELIQWHESCRVAQCRHAGVWKVSQWEDPASQGNSDLSIMRVGGTKFVNEDRLIQLAGTWQRN